MRRWPRLNREHLMREIHLIDSQGQIYRGAEVARVLSRRIPRLWPLTPLLHIPGSLPLWQWLYGIISRGRFLLGRRKTCDTGFCSWHRGHS
jgi:predicted DCC family thiol-disulfide oxidoreductase YuxK